MSETAAASKCRPMCERPGQAEPAEDRASRESGTGTRHGSEVAARCKKLGLPVRADVKRMELGRVSRGLTSAYAPDRLAVIVLSGAVELSEGQQSQ